MAEDPVFERATRFLSALRHCQVLGLKLHMLVAGATYNLHTRLAQAGSLNVPKE